MFESFQEIEGTPPEIFTFERLWLFAMVVSVIIAIMMFDYSAMIVGVFLAGAINIILFAIAATLMIYTSRRQSNVARWLLAVPFNLLLLSYDLSHLIEEIHRFPAGYLAVLRLSLMAVATYMLFTTNARAWFTHRELPLPPDDDL